MKQEGITGVVMYTTNPYFDSDSHHDASLIEWQLHVLMAAS